MIKRLIQRCRNYCRKNRWPLAIAALAAIASLLYAGLIKPPLNVDAKAHHRIAVNIATGNGYWEAMPPDPAFDRAIGRSGPLFEYWVAIPYALFGPHPFIVWIIHALMHGATVYLIFLITRNLFTKHEQRETIGMIAAASYGFYPDLIEISAMLMTETSFLFIGALLLYTFLRYDQTSARSWLAAFSILAGLAFLAKSTVALPGLAFVGYFVYQRQWRELAAVSVIVVVVVAPWTIRNYRAFDTFIPSRLYGYYTLHVGNHPNASGENENHLMLREKAVEDEGGVFALESYSKEQFHSFVRNHPIEYAALHAKRLSIYFSWLRPTGHWPYLTTPQRLGTYGSSAAWFVVISALGLTGLWLAWRQLPKQAARSIIIAALLTPIPFVMTVVETRYRYSLYPFLAIFAGYAAVQLWKHRDVYALRVFTITAIILAINTAIDLWANWQRFIDRIIS